MSSPDIKAQIDADNGLKSKRKALVFTSLLLIGIQFTGAQITEANTFIFKINFIHQNGLSVLLIAAVICMSIRYYGYAKQYQDKLSLLVRY